MAKDESTKNHRPVTVTKGDLEALCDRLTARGMSILLQDQPEQARDLVLAAKALRFLIRHVDSSDLIAIENDN